ncbi:MAG: hypothetical protein C5B47_01695 [Verrucomicrobia bacterium]|nr:MAG: hypothetical protein C5B47_01695 [Verrucomicrobiota bacterium]
MSKNARFLFVEILGSLALLTACSSPPSNFSQIPSNEPSQQISRVLWIPQEGDPISLQAIRTSAPSHPTVHLVLEKEGALILQLKASSNFISARSPLLGNWRGPPSRAPKALKIWIAFALSQKNLMMEGFRWQEGNCSLLSADGKESLYVLRKSSGR